MTFTTRRVSSNPKIHDVKIKLAQNTDMHKEKRADQ